MEIQVTEVTKCKIYMGLEIKFFKIVLIIWPVKFSQIIVIIVIITTIII